MFSLNPSRRDQLVWSKVVKKTYSKDGCSINRLKIYPVTQNIRFWFSIFKRFSAKYDDSQSRTPDFLGSPQIDTFSTSGLSSREAEKARRKYDKVS